MSSIIFLFVTCKKDKHICEPIEEFTNEIGESLYKDDSLIFQRHPHFNPNNSDEIIFVSVNKESFPIVDLIKYNIKNKEQSIILQAHIVGKPRWGSNDWILFTMEVNGYYNIYKIKSNGEGLTLLSPPSETFRYFDPLWDFDNENIIYRVALGTPTLFYFADTEGNIIDTLLVGGEQSSSWNHPKYMANGQHNGLIIIDSISTEKFEILHELPTSFGAVGSDWLDEERVIWTHMTGVYITNINTRETILIQESCNADFLKFPTYAPDIDKVIFNRIERYKENRRDEIGFARSSFYMMRPDGTEGETLNLD